MGCTLNRAFNIDRRLELTNPLPSQHEFCLIAGVMLTSHAILHCVQTSVQSTIYFTVMIFSIKNKDFEPLLKVS